MAQNRILKHLTLFCIIIILLSCYSQPPVEIKWDNTASKGRYHRVRKGETLYGLSKYYKKDITVLRKINGLKPSGQLEVNSHIFIPTNRFSEYWLASNNQDHISDDSNITPKKVKPIKKWTRKIADKKESKKTASKKYGIEEKKKAIVITASSESPRKTTKKKSFGRTSDYKLTSGFEWPVDGTVVSTFSNGWDKNSGIDIVAPKGTVIKAAQKGKVIYEGSDFPGFGKIIIIEHKNGLATVYGYNEQNLVKAEQYVNQGTQIATVGNSGVANKNMLHFEIRKNSKAIDPLKYLN